MTWLLAPRQVLIWALLILLAAGVGAVAYDELAREEPAPVYESDEEHFLYGSIGTEREQGVPYWIWLVLPRIFPEYLPGPGGYAAIGVLGRDGREMPIGFSKLTIGYPRVGVTCALCHTASVRTRPDEAPVIYPAAASHQVGAQEYVRFLTASARDPRFSAGTILREIDRNTRLPFLSRLVYRFVIVPNTRRALLRLGESRDWTRTRPDWGRGRTDVVNPVKFTLLGQPADDTIGSADVMPLWNLQERDGMSYHWDGLNTSLREATASAALGEGATVDWVDQDVGNWDREGPRRSSLRRVTDYIGRVQPPPYPFPIDAALAESGAALYATACAGCHQTGGARAGSVIPLEEVGTDRHRTEAWTEGAASAYNDYGNGRAWKFSTFRKTAGYVAVPLEGVWLSAPYLHNGSVPALADLLEPPASRPAAFYRGYDVYDPVRVGFVAGGPEAERVGTLYEVSRPGNGNSGHTYGTDLTAEQKRALLEFLKTL